MMISKLYLFIVLFFSLISDTQYFYTYLGEVIEVEILKNIFRRGSISGFFPCQLQTNSLTGSPKFKAPHWLM